MLAGCVHSGVQYDHGAEWRSAGSPCDVCYCLVGLTLIGNSTLVSSLSNFVCVVIVFYSSRLKQD